MYELQDGRRHTDLLSRSRFGASPGDVVLGERPARTKEGNGFSNLFTLRDSRGNQALAKTKLLISSHLRYNGFNV